MATGVSRAHFDPLRTLNFSGISGTYAAVGPPLANQVRAFCITNNTQGDMIFSLDNTVSEGHMFIARGSYKLYDIQSNTNPKFDDKFIISIGTQFYVKQLAAPVSGDVFIECLF